VKLPPLILASASPRRAELLRLLKVEFEVLPTHVAEVAYEHLSPLEVCQLNAHRKARAAAKKIPDRIVLSLIHLRMHRERLFAVSTDVLFHPLEPDQVEEYLSKVDPLDKAGAYAIQEYGDRIISEISGSYSNVVGLPVEKLRTELAAWG
jgi:septum formation protein